MERKEKLTLEECITLAKKVDKWDYYLEYAHPEFDASYLLGGAFTGNLINRLFFKLRDNRENSRGTYCLTVSYLPLLARLELTESNGVTMVELQTPQVFESGKYSLRSREDTDLVSFDNVRSTRLKKLYLSLSGRLKGIKDRQTITLKEPSENLVHEGVEYARKFL